MVYERRGSRRHASEALSLGEVLGAHLVGKQEKRRRDFIRRVAQPPSMIQTLRVAAVGVNQQAVSPATSRADADYRDACSRSSGLFRGSCSISVCWLGGHPIELP